MSGCHSRRTGASATRTGRPSRSAARCPARPRGSSSSGTPPAGSTTTSGSSETACLRAGRFPKGVPLAAGERHLAVHVEDHPLDYADFEGEIPAGEYGAGTVEIWDRGTYELVEEKKDGGLTVRLHGTRLEGLWTLVPARLDGDPRNWLLLRKDGGATARSYAPMLATSTDALPTGGGWAFEPKWDGYRALARIVGGEATLRSRNDNDLSARFPAVARALGRAVRYAGGRARRRDLCPRRDRSLRVRSAAAGGRRARLRRLRRARA